MFLSTIKINQDCLDPEIKLAKILNKARIIETGSSQTDEEILNEAIEGEDDVW